MSDNSGQVDLLGDPVRPLPDKRGRRKLRFPVQVYEQVEVLSATNMSQEDIADAVGISAPTLRKYFRQELDKGPARQRARVLKKLAEQAEGGNVSAIKVYLAELDKQRAIAALREREKSPQPESVGKKELRQRAADHVAAAGGKYATPPPPSLIVDNT